MPQTAPAVAGPGTAARPNESPRPRERMLAYDALRLFAILTVVAIHCFMPLRGRLPATSIQLVIDDVLHYAVPVFVFISGALLWSRPWPSRPGALSAFARKRLSIVGLPYVFWALLFFLLALSRAADPASRLAEGPGLLLTGHVWYHLYFVPMLLTFYALTPLAAPLMRRSPELGVLLAYAVRLLLWPVLSPWLQAHAPDLAWSYASHIVAHLPHMALGAWFALRLEIFPLWLRKWSWPVLLTYGLGGLTALSLGMLGTWHFLLRRLAEADFMAGAVLGLTLLAFQLEPLWRRLERPVLVGSALSFGVYFVHPLFLEAVTEAVRETGAERLWFEWWAVPLAWGIITSASFVTAWLLSVSPKTAWLVGARTPRKGPA